MAVFTEIVEFIVNLLQSKYIAQIAFIIDTLSLTAFFVYIGLNFGFAGAFCHYGNANTGKPWVAGKHS